MAKVMIDGMEFTVRELFLDCTVRSHGVQLHGEAKYYRPACIYHIIRYADGHYYYKLQRVDLNTQWQRITVKKVAFIISRCLEYGYSIGF